MELEDAKLSEVRRTTDSSHMIYRSTNEGYKKMIITLKSIDIYKNTLNV